MNDTTTPAPKSFATLTRGNVYILGDKIFEAGVAVEVTAEEKAILVADAVDFITVEGEEIARPKFTFNDAAGDEGEENISGGTSRPRTRAR